MEPENVLIAPTRSAAGIKLLLASLFGIAIFFIPFELTGRSTIMVDHLAGFLIAQRPLAVGLILLLIGYGAITPLLDGRWRARPIDRLLSLFKLIGLVLALMYVANLGPAWLMTPDRLPFLFDKLAMSVGLIVPIGAMALTFLLGFGLLELIGVLMQPVMRPLWRTPGHSAIDAVASFVGSYSVGLLITNRVFLAGKYTVREAVIIATGFSTVSAAFMIIVAKTLNLMEHWNFYFWSTLVITFVITAILARVPPISNMAHHGETDEPLPAGKNRWQAALASGLTQSSMAQPVLRQLQDNLKDGLLMAAAVVPTILSVCSVCCWRSTHRCSTCWAGCCGLSPGCWNWANRWKLPGHFLPGWQRCSCPPFCSKMPTCWCAMSPQWYRSARFSSSPPPYPASWPPGSR
nr:YjiH family protein [Aeromonas salmonicida]